MKKLLAILCVVAVLFCSLFTGVVVSAEDAGLTKLSPSVDQMAAVSCDPSAPSHYRQPFHNATYTAMVQTVGSANEYLAFKNGGTSFSVFFGNANQVEFKKAGLTTADGSALANYTAGGDFKTRFFKIEITSKVVDEKLNIVVKLDDEIAGDFTFNEANAFNATYSSREFAGVIVYDVDYQLREDEIIDPALLLPVKKLSDFNITEGEVYTIDPTNTNAHKGGVGGSVIDKLLSIDMMLEANGYVRYPSFINYSGHNKSFMLKTSGGNLVLDASAFANEFSDTSRVEPAVTDPANLATITPADLGLTTLLGAKLHYQVAVQACNADDETLAEGVEIKNDIKFTFFMNGHKFYEVVVRGEASDYTPVEDESGNIIGVENVVSEGGLALFVDCAKDYTNNDDPYKFTLNSLYLTQGRFTEHTESIPDLPVKTHDASALGNKVTADANINLAGNPYINTVFGSKITFNKIGGQYLFSGIGAFNLNNNTGKLEFNDFNNVYTLTDYNAVGVAHEIKIVSKGVSIDGGAYPNDLKLQIFVNGVLKYTAYHANNITSKLGKSVHITAGGVGADVTLEQASFVPNSVREITPADGGFDEDRTITFPATAENKHEDDFIAGNDLYIGYNKKANTSLNLLDSLFTAKITNNLEAGSVALFNAGGAQINCSITAANQIQVFAFGNFFAVAQTIPVAKGTEFTFQFTVQYSDFDEDGNGLLDDIRFGIFIDGQLLGGKFWSMMDRDIRYYAVNETTKAEFVNWTNFNFKTQAYCAGGKTSMAGSITIKNPVDNSEAYKNYETITLEDYGVVPGTYSPDSSNNLLPRWIASLFNEDMLTINGKVLKATFTIPTATNYTELAFISNSAGGHGISARFEANGGIAYIKNTKGTSNGTGFPLGDVKYDVAQEWMVTFDYEADGAIKLGVWIDGKLQNNAYYYCYGYGASSDAKAISLYKAGDPATVTFGDANNYTNAEIAEGGYTFTPAAGQTYTYGETTITSDAPYTFESVGEYVVTYTAAKGSYAITGNKTIVVFKANDINADNEINILDFIIAKKNAAGERELGTALERAAAGKYDVNELCDAYDIADIKALILG